MLKIGNKKRSAASSSYRARVTSAKNAKTISKITSKKTRASASKSEDLNESDNLFDKLDREFDENWIREFGNDDSGDDDDEDDDDDDDDDGIDYENDPKLKHAMAEIEKLINRFGPEHRDEVLSMLCNSSKKPEDFPDDFSGNYPGNFPDNLLSNFPDLGSPKDFSNLRSPEDIDSEYFDRLGDIYFDHAIANFKALSEQNLDLWKRLLDLSVEFYKMKPWDSLYEQDVFAVQSPNDANVAYCSVMGARGEHYALFAYRGADGYRRFEFFRNTYTDSFEGPDPMFFLMNQSGIQMSYEKYEDLTPADLELYNRTNMLEDIKISPGKRKRAVYPVFRDYTSGFLPWFLNMQQVRFMIDVVLQAMELVPIVEREPPTPEARLSEEQDATGLSALSKQPYIKIRGRSYQKNGKTGKWIDTSFEPESIELCDPITKENGSPSAQLVQQIKDYAKTDVPRSGTWRVEIMRIGSLDQHGGARPSFPVRLFIESGNKGNIVYDNTSMNPIVTNPFYSNFVKWLTTSKTLPKTVFVTGSSLKNIVQPIFEPLSIPIKIKNGLY